MPKQNRGHLFAPLDQVLGTDASVRLLRILSQMGDAYATPRDLARWTGLDRAGVYRTLDRLREAGTVEYAEAPGPRRCRIRRAHPLAKAIIQLFEAEKGRVSGLLRAVEDAVEALRPPPMSAWLSGPALREEPDAGSSLVLNILDTPAEVDRHADELRDALAELEGRQDITLEVRGFTPADLEAMDEAGRGVLSRDEGLHVYGFAPDALLWTPSRRRAVRTHRELDALALARGRALGERVRESPELIQRARRWVERRLEDPAVSDGEKAELREWERILATSSPPRLAEVLSDPGQRSTRLRQTNPFLPILDEEERSELAAGERE